MSLSANLASVVGAYYYVRIVKIMFFDEAKEKFLAVPLKAALVMGLADQVSVFHHGEILAEGPPSEIQNNPRVLEVYLKT